MINKLLTLILLAIPCQSVTIDQQVDEQLQIQPMNNRQAQCYLNRYPDLQRAFGKNNINAAKHHWLNYGHKEHRKKTCEKPLTGREAACYVPRYEDLAKAWEGKALSEQIRLAREHWLEYGINEGRQRHCAPRITEQQAKCYLNTYPELYNRFGVDKSSWVQAQESFYKHGFYQGKKAVCPTPPKSCASATEGPTCQCAADGLIYFGKRYNTYHGSLPEKATFEQMYNWKTAVSKPIGGRQTCNYHALGDPWPGFVKQCFCEPKVHVKPIHIADQNGGWRRLQHRQQPRILRHNSGCRNWQQTRLSVHNDRDYTVNECDALCVANEQCDFFMRGNRAQKIGDCELYRDKPACQWYSDNRQQFYRSSNYDPKKTLKRPDVCPLTSYVYYGRRFAEDKKTKLTFDQMVKLPYERSLVDDTWTNGCNANRIGIQDFDQKHPKQCFCDYDDFYSDDQYNKDQIRFDDELKRAEAEKIALQKKREEDARRKAEAEARRIAQEKKAALKRLEDAQREASNKRLEKERALQKKLESKEEKKEESKEEKKEEKVKSENWVDDIIYSVPAYKKFSGFTD